MMCDCKQIYLRLPYILFYYSVILFPTTLPTFFVWYKSQKCLSIKIILLPINIQYNTHKKTKQKNCLL